MRKCPAIGDRVRYIGGPVVGPCTGTVEAIYPTEEWDYECDRPTGRYKPEHEWQVRMRVDALPTPWCYGSRTAFAPEVSKLRRLRPNQ